MFNFRLVEVLSFLLFVLCCGFATACVQQIWLGGPQPEQYQPDEMMIYRLERKAFLALRFTALASALVSMLLTCCVGALARIAEKLSASENRSGL